MHIQYDKITFCLKFQKEFNFGSDLTFFSSLRHANLFFRKSLPPALPRPPSVRREVQGQGG